MQRIACFWPTFVYGFMPEDFMHISYFFYTWIEKCISTPLWYKVLLLAYKAFHFETEL